MSSDEPVYYLVESISRRCRCGVLITDCAYCFDEHKREKDSTIKRCVGCNEILLDWDVHQTGDLHNTCNRLSCSKWLLKTYGCPADDEVRIELVAYQQNRERLYPRKISCFNKPLCSETLISDIKTEIEKRYHIPIEHQLLLEPHKNVYEILNVLENATTEPYFLHQQEERTVTVAGSSPENHQKEINFVHLHLAVLQNEMTSEQTKQQYDELDIQSFQQIEIKAFGSRKMLLKSRYYQCGGNGIRLKIQQVYGIPERNQVLIDGEGKRHFENNKYIQKDVFDADDVEELNDALPENPDFVRDGVLYLTVVCYGGKFTNERDFDAVCQEHDIKPIKDFNTFKLQLLTKEDVLRSDQFKYVSYVREYVAEKYDVRYEDQVLYFKGEKLSDGRKTFDLFLRDNSPKPLTLNLVVDKQPYTVKIIPRAFNAVQYPVLEVDDNVKVTDLKVQLARKYTNHDCYRYIDLSTEQEHTRLEDGKTLGDYSCLRDCLKEGIVVRQCMVVRLTYTDIGGDDEEEVVEFDEIVGSDLKSKTVKMLVKEILETYNLKKRQIIELNGNVGDDDDGGGVAVELTSERMLNEFHQLNLRISKSSGSMGCFVM